MHTGHGLARRSTFQCTGSGHSMLSCNVCTDLFQSFFCVAHPSLLCVCRYTILLSILAEQCAEVEAYVCRVHAALVGMRAFAEFMERKGTSPQKRAQTHRSQHHTDRPPHKATSGQSPATQPSQVHVNPGPSISSSSSSASDCDTRAAHSSKGWGPYSKQLVQGLEDKLDFVMELLRAFKVEGSFMTSHPRSGIASTPRQEERDQGNRGSRSRSRARRTSNGSSQGPRQRVDSSQSGPRERKGEALPARLVQFWARMLQAVEAMEGIFWRYVVRRLLHLLALSMCALVSNLCVRVLYRTNASCGAQVLVDLPRCCPLAPLQLSVEFGRLRCGWWSRKGCSKHSEEACGIKAQRSDTRCRDKCKCLGRKPEYDLARATEQSEGNSR